MKFYKFDPKKYNFREIIEEYLEINDLENIYDSELKFESPRDCLNTHYHKLYDNKIKKNPKFLSLYKKFMNEYATKIVNFNFLFEKYPCIRVHQKNNVSVLDYHIDSEYLIPDGTYDVYKHEINFWMPLTNSYGTNSLWVESFPKKKDYSPIEASYGDLIQFNGATLCHGTEVNNTCQTRVSLDFRILPTKIYEENKKNLSENVKNTLNNYYDKLSTILYN
jgi:hypothetical protein